MSKREPSLAEFIEWIQRLDDPYKVFLFTLLNAIFLYAIVTTGHGIDLDSIRELVVGTVIETLGDETLNFLWTVIFQPILSFAGLIQLVISIYAIWKFRWLGVIVSVSGFVGWILLFFTSYYGWPQIVFWIGIVLVVVSYVIARYSSNLKFDPEGNVIFD